LGGEGRGAGGHTQEPGSAQAALHAGWTPQERLCSEARPHWAHGLPAHARTPNRPRPQPPSSQPPSRSSRRCPTSRSTTRCTAWSPTCRSVGPPPYRLPRSAAACLGRLSQVAAACPDRHPPRHPPPLPAGDARRRGPQGGAHVDRGGAGERRIDSLVVLERPHCLRD
jgi:hypothetical protein